MNTIEIKKITENFLPFPSVRWVAKACSRDKARWILRTIHIENYKDQSVAVATDGKRLHAARLDIQYPAGNYDVISNNEKAMFLKETDCTDTFPNYCQVIPSYQKKEMKKMFFRKEHYVMMEGVRTFKIAVEIHKLNGAFFNIDYLVDAMDIFGACFVKQHAEQLAPLLIQDTDSPKTWTRLAVIMPVRVPKED